MPAKVSRKYDRLTKYLNSVISNEGMSPKVRMQATETLNSIYSRHEHYADRAAARKERAELRALGIKSGTVPQVPAEPEAPEPSAFEATTEERRRFDEILGRSQRIDSQR
jgi:hypothetical protein